MKKINWFRRLFMTWSSLEKYFGAKASDNFSEELLKEVRTRNEELKERNLELNRELAVAKEKIDQATPELNTKDKTIIELKSALEQAKYLLDERKNNNKVLSNEIRDQLKTIGKIEKTFFASTGNKGKGELGERQVKLILEKSGLSKDLWVENLQVNSKNVEFAIKSGEDGKFIPVDSKVLETNTYDENGKPVIDQAYATKIKQQAKKISEYLNKTNTASYGIMVLQSDEIYMALFNEFPNIFREVIDEYKVQVSSPSSFVQSAWGISNILNIYEKIHNEEKIYEQVIDTLVSVNKFATSLEKVHNNFNIAMNTHYKTIQSRQDKLVKKLKKEDKIKELPNLKGDE